MPVLDSYLFFTGRCAEAMRFYERTLGGKLDALMTYADSPDPQHCPAGAGDLAGDANDGADVCDGAGGDAGVVSAVSAGADRRGSGGRAGPITRPTFG